MIKIKMIFNVLGNLLDRSHCGGLNEDDLHRLTYLNS